MKRFLTGVLSLRAFTSGVMPVLFMERMSTGRVEFLAPASRLLMTGGGDAASTELNIYMWQQYISDQLIADFEAANTT